MGVTWLIEVSIFEGSKWGFLAGVQMMYVCYVIWKISDSGCYSLFNLNRFCKMFKYHY